MTQKLQAANLSNNASEDFAKDHDNQVDNSSTQPTFNSILLSLISHRKILKGGLGAIGRTSHVLGKPIPNR